MAAVLAAAGTTLLLVIGLGPITVPVTAGLGLLVVVGMLALMLVMRSLLRRATGFSTELAGVV